MFQFPPLLSTPTGYNSQIPPFSLHPISRCAYILQIPLVKLVCSGHVQTGVVFRFSTGRLVPVGLYRYTPTGTKLETTRVCTCPAKSPTGTNYSTSMHSEGAGGVPPPDPQLKRKQSHATLYLGLRQSGGKHDNSKSTVPGIF